MSTKKISLNELKSLIKQIIKEQTVSTHNQNLNEEKINGGSFKDYDFKFVGDNLKELIINYKIKPYISEVKKDLNIIKNRFREGSIYNLFEPKLGIIYLSVYGWDRGWNAYLTTDEHSKFEDKPFFDEPTGKFAKSRIIIKF